MMGVATLYVRDVPEGLHKRLRARARRHGRSLNAEIVEILRTVADGDRATASVTKRLAELAREIDWPEDAPTPEQFVRDLRDADDAGRL